ncbi:heavy metal translocating P-type ATPase [Candidatus Sumerlaeota bacterium]|nr:heavy metal translocating P-type ATPase [Candidatus Sumerlaeota bacterium]
MEPLEGVASLDFDILNAKMSVEWIEDSPDLDAIAAAVAGTGMRASPWRDEGVGERQSLWSRHGRLIMTCVSGIACAAALALQLADLLTARTALCAVAIVSGGWFVFPRAVTSARRLRLDMNFLMTVAVISAAVIGEWFEASTVAFLFSLALLLESWSISRARRAVRALMDLSPPTAHVVCPRDGDISDRPVAEVGVGETVIVRPGERFPLDGVVTRGTSAVNQAPITGESAPVDRVEGDEVFAGSINGHGALEIRVTREADDTLLARMAHLVQESHRRRGQVEQWTDRFARIYTPAMIALSVVIMLVGPLLGGEWSAWFYRGLVVLVIACPCALVISTPVTVVAGLASAARRGVLIKGGLFLETPAHLRAMAIDKTGTLTLGAPRVQEVIPLNGHTRAELLERAAALEAHSEHPLARAVVACAESEGLTPSPASSHRALPGRGAEGDIAGQRFWIGSHRLLAVKTEVTDEVLAHAESLEDAGHSVVLVGNEQHVCGLISVADAVREEAAEMVAALHRAGVRRVVMLTGDNAATAQAIARETGVDEVRAGLLPEEKVEVIERLLAEHGRVAMVGDGVNDAPAMARATVGIAMGAAGTDAAIETADIALMADDLSALPWLVHHSRRALRTLRQNIGFALGIKLIFLALAVPGCATLWMAIAADMGASLAVIFNGMRLLRG